MWPSEVGVRVAKPEDMRAVMTALAALAKDLNDPFRASEAMIREALFGAHAHSVALMAGDAPRGVVLMSPFVSTVLGCPCAYVSDLWVAQAARGQSLGRRLLCAAAQEAQARWGAEALYLNVYGHSTKSQAFYRHIGFVFHDDARRASLTGAALDALMTSGAPA